MKAGFGEGESFFPRRSEQHFRRFPEQVLSPLLHLPEIIQKCRGRPWQVIQAAPRQDLYHLYDFATVPPIQSDQYFFGRAD